jgi:2'-5' RNA ligase
LAKIRTFIAVELPEPFKQTLAQLQEKIGAGSRAPVKWVAPGSIHLTLKFLGNIDESLAGKVTEAIEAAAGGVHPFRIQLKDLGAFPNLNRVNIIWVGLAGDIDGLKALQRRIDESLKPLGFKPENRPFTPHLTLARVRDRATKDERAALGRIISETSSLPPMVPSTRASPP